MTKAGLPVSGVPLLHRLPILGLGLALGAAFSVLAAVAIAPGPKIADRVVTWAWVMGGPIAGTASGVAEFQPAILLGWLGLLLIPVHPCCPRPATGCVTLFGFSLWFFAGFLGVTAAATAYIP